LVATSQQRLSLHATSWWWTISLLMLLQIYFAMRADFDRRIFEQLAVEPETIQASLIAFDEALASAGITRHRTRGRPIGERIRRTASLVRRMGYVLLLQFLIAALSSALPQ